MADHLLRLYAWQLTFRAAYAGRHRDERGEGVISAAIAVLIMAFLGVLVWKGFSATLDKSQSKVDTKVGEIGQ